MFYEELIKIKHEFKAFFDFKILFEIKESDVATESSSVLAKDDFIIITLKGRADLFCPIKIYLGINHAAGYYGLYFNETATIYNHEKFDTFYLFEKELYHFMGNPVRAELVRMSDDSKIYTDYFISDYDSKKSFLFREYYKKTWWNLFGLKKTKKETKNFLAWLR